MQCSGFDGIHGRQGCGPRNLKGTRLLKFCYADELIVTSTCFLKSRSSLSFTLQVNVLPSLIVS